MTEQVKPILHRLTRAPFEFLSAVASSPSALYTFSEEWFGLRGDLDRALGLSLLSDEDIILARDAVSVVAVLGESFEELDRKAAAMKGEMEDIFASLSIEDHTPHPSELRISAPPLRPTLRSSSSQIHIAPAYAWLSANIHNPYPSTEDKKRISVDAGVPVRTISTWFKDVRRAMGWVSLCKTHFQGSRALAVEAARRAFIEPEPVFLSSRVGSEFIAMQTRLATVFYAMDDDELSADEEKSSYSRILSSSSPSLGRRSLASTPSLVFTSDEESDWQPPKASYDYDNEPRNVRKRRISVGDGHIKAFKRPRCVTISCRMMMV